ncbi:murein transglycosylase [Phlyctema vagabunda]|uniref:AA9 family lytic polysaccharide monooxygenase n=1 Tax=Phlyctema vagabunda TaxID=108571 RepID=A0ABR4PVN4_9HELO
MKAVSSATTDGAAGDGWFKIWEEGYDSATSQWCTEKLIQNNGFLSVNVPSDLAGGYYLVRPELLALQDADKSPPNPQFYVGCAQIFLKSTATAVPADTVSIPGHVDISNPSLLFNVYQPQFPYPLFGPAVYTSASSQSKVASVAQATTQSEGLLPADVILTNANWWATELEPYSTQDGCWNASKTCWAENQVCYDTAPPTGSKNCKIWEAKCQAINDACSANDFNGPPNAGTNLEPAAQTYDSIPAAQVVPGQDQASAPVSETPESTSVASPAPTTAVEAPQPTSVNEPAATTTEVPTTTSGAETPTETEDTECEADLPQATAVSEDATCGGYTGLTCLGSNFGNCCSYAGWCGSSSEYCGDGCQSDFGSCGASAERRDTSRGRFIRSHARHRHV